MQRFEVHATDEDGARKVGESTPEEFARFLAEWSKDYPGAVFVLVQIDGEEE